MVALACKVFFNWVHRLYSRCTAIPYPGITKNFIVKLHIKSITLPRWCGKSGAQRNHCIWLTRMARGNYKKILGLVPWQFSSYWAAKENQDEKNYVGTNCRRNSTKRKRRRKWLYRTCTSVECATRDKVEKIAKLKAVRNFLQPDVQMGIGCCEYATNIRKFKMDGKQPVKKPSLVNVIEAIHEKKELSRKKWHKEKIALLRLLLPKVRLEEGTKGESYMNLELHWWGNKLFNLLIQRSIQLQMLHHYADCRKFAKKSEVEIFIYFFIFSINFNYITVWCTGWFKISFEYTESCYHMYERRYFLLLFCFQFTILIYDLLFHYSEIVNSLDTYSESPCIEKRK